MLFIPRLFLRQGDPWCGAIKQLPLRVMLVLAGDDRVVWFGKPKNFGEDPKTWKLPNQRAPNPPEFAQPRLSRVKRRSSPARGYKFGCVCSYMAGIAQGLCKFGWVWSSLTQKRIREDAIGSILDPGSKGLPRVSCTIGTWLAPAQPHVWHQCKRLCAPSARENLCTLS